MGPVITRTKGSSIAAGQNNEPKIEQHWPVFTWDSAVLFLCERCSCFSCYKLVRKVYNRYCITNNKIPLSIIKHQQKMLKLLQIIICQLCQLFSPHQRKHFQERVVTMLYQEFSGD